MSDNPEVARGLKLKIEPDNQSCVPINTCEFNAQNWGYMDGVGPISTTLPSEGGNMLGDGQDPLLLEDFKGNFALDSATDGGNVSGLQGRNDQIKCVKNEETTWTDEMENVLITAGDNVTGLQGKKDQIKCVKDEETIWTDELEKFFITEGCYAGEGSRSPNLAPKYRCACQDSPFWLSLKRKRENGEGEGESSLDSFVESRWIQLQEEELNIQEQKLKLEKKRIRWLRRWRQLDLELDQKRLNNMLLKLQIRKNTGS